MEEEIWKEIPGYESKYQVSNVGNIKYIGNGSLGYKNRSLALHKNKDGYLCICIYNNDGVRKNIRLHRMVALAFMENPNNHPIVMHLDNNPSNNKIHNLKWGTIKENCEQRERDGRGNNYIKNFKPLYHLGKFGAKNANAKAILQYTLDGVFIREWDSLMDAHRGIGVGATTLSTHLHLKCKSAGGFIWKFK